MKYYFLFFFIFCIFIGGGTYILNPDPISISLFQKTLTLPLALWMLGGVSLFFLISLIVFAKDWAKKILSNRKEEKDLNLIIDQIYHQALGESLSPSTPKTHSLQILAKILKRFSLSPKLNSPQSNYPKIDELFRDLEALEKGEVLKKTFEKNTIFWEKNLINKIDSDLKFAQKILNEDNDEKLKEEAILSLIDHNALNEKLIPKVTKLHNTHKILNHLLDKGYKLEKEDFLLLLLKVDSKHYLHFAQAFKKYFDPDFCIALFQELSLQKPEARNAYIYILLDYSMFDQARKFLEENQDLILPKIYIDLKDRGENYPLESFFTF